MDAVLIILIISGGVFLFIRAIRNRTKVIVDENSFTQNGVSVNFSAETISIGKYTYPAKLVTGIRTNTSSGGRTILANAGSVDIEIDDFKKPVHKIIFNGYSVEKDTKEFAQRLSIALRKAGGTSFT